MKLLKTIPIASCVLAALVASPAHAEDVYKIGVSAGLTGYAAAVDRCMARRPRGRGRPCEFQRRRSWVARSR